MCSVFRTSLWSQSYCLWPFRLFRTERGLVVTFTQSEETRRLPLRQASRSTEQRLLSSVSPDCSMVFRLCSSPWNLTALRRLPATEIEQTRSVSSDRFLRQKRRDCQFGGACRIR